MMKRLTLILATLAVTFAASAGHYKNFRNTAYIMAGDVNRIGTVENWEKSYAEFSKNLQLDKVYIETFRDMTYSDGKALEAAIKFFKSKGIEVSGGITYNWRGGVRQRWESFCYSNPEHLAIIQGVIERTVALFTYDNGTFVAHSFQDKPVEVSFVFQGNRLTDIGSGMKIDGSARPVFPVNGHSRTGAQETVVKVTLPPHSFRAFKIDK